MQNIMGGIWDNNEKSQCTLNQLALAQFLGSDHMRLVKEFTNTSWEKNCHPEMGGKWNQWVNIYDFPKTLILSFPQLQSYCNKRDKKEFTSWTYQLITETKGPLKFQRGISFVYVSSKPAI